ncbi:MAG: hypothetical protein JKY51_04730, partial [Opitutaceae bacterium]|nr:hypothetical protein [Opitutaceae bacterium]
MTSDSKLTKKHLATRLKRTDPSHSEDAHNAQLQEKEHLDGLVLLRTVLDTIGEPIYIVDLESDEIIFANKKVDQLYGSTVGRRCWESLQKGISARCSFCTNNHLLDNDGRPTGIYQSRYKNTLTGRWYQCSDQAFEWIDGRIVAIKTSVDVTALVESISSAEELYKENNILSKKIATSRIEERKNLSQKLHDELGSIGAAIKLNSEFLQTQIPTEMKREKSAAEDLVNLSQKFLEIVRKISNDLNPYAAISHMTVTEMLEELFNE